MKYFSMFSGIGGFELGIQRAYNNKHESSKSEQTIGEERGKWDINKQKLSFCFTDNPPLCVGYSEIDKYAIQVYESHFGGHKNYGNAKDINPSDLPDFDLLCGGFPCQAFSIAGKRRGFEDTRGTLFFEIARIIKSKRPRYLLLENVKGLLSHDKGKTFSIILETLRELGYRVDYGVLNSRYFGVPQNRERVFIVGSLRGERQLEIFPLCTDNTKIDSERIIHPTITQAIGRMGSSKEYMKSIEMIELTKNVSDAQRVYDTRGISKTLKGLGGGMGAKTGLYAFSNSSQRDYKQPKIVKTPFQIRRLTPVECARLQGFPDHWHKIEGISDTQAYKCYGNAVSVPVIEAIMNRIL